MSGIKRPSDGPQSDTKKQRPMPGAPGAPSGPPDKDAVGSNKMEKREKGAFKRAVESLHQLRNTLCVMRNIATLTDFLAATIFPSATEQLSRSPL
jgi:hypothetical protein